MDNTEFLLKMEDAIQGVQLDADAFLNQHNLTTDNVQLATFSAIEMAFERLNTDYEENPELFQVLQSLAAASFALGWLMGQVVLNERNN